VTFDPNNPPQPPPHRWGSYSPRYTKNRPRWKTHARLRDVRSAIDAANEIKVYELVDDRWELRYEHGYSKPRPRPIPGDRCYVCEALIFRRRNQQHYDWVYWSPDEPFVKVRIHRTCKPKLGVFHE
jgi:hypothetical protein